MSFAREQLPRFVTPMFARTATVPLGEGWAVEVKFDGMRLQLRHDGHAVCPRSRPGRDCSEEFPELAAIAGPLGRHRVLLDGELVCLGADGSGLRQSPQAPTRPGRQGAPARRAEAGHFLAFDLLHLDGRSPRELPYERRRELLLELGLDDGVRWRTPRHFVADSKQLLAATRERGLEGVVAKRLASKYLPGVRSGAWVKHKHRRTESFLVSGWSPPERRRPESLLLARVGSDGTLESAGSVPLVLGNGQTDDVRRRLEPLVLPPIGAVSASAAWRRRCGQSSPSTGRPAGPSATRSSAPSARSSRPARVSRCSSAVTQAATERSSERRATSRRGVRGPLWSSPRSVSRTPSEFRLLLWDADPSGTSRL